MKAPFRSIATCADGFSSIAARHFYRVSFGPDNSKMLTLGVTVSGHAGRAEAVCGRCLHRCGPGLQINGTKLHLDLHLQCDLQR